MAHPKIAQGGMGIGASTWLLARLVSLLGQLGIVSGAAYQVVFARLLQLGDEGGHFRRALKAFPNQAMARRVKKQYYVRGGISPTAKFKKVRPFTFNPPRDLIELTIVANFCQVWLAGEGHNGKIGVNFLEKLQMPHLYAIYGMLLAAKLLAGDVYLIIGAGIPIQVSDVLDKLIKHEPATYDIYVIGTDKSKKYQMYFNPRAFMHKVLPELKRPFFFPIISLYSIAEMMTKSGKHKVDGWVYEDETAAGHNMNPRGKKKLNRLNRFGEPIWGKKDRMNFAKLKKCGLPFYIAGSQASPEMLDRALKMGAIGIQVGSIFALCNPSGFMRDLKEQLRRDAYNGDLVVLSSAVFSSTGFSFKIACKRGTLSDPHILAQRQRVCDVGALRVPYLKPDGSIGYRCSAEPVASYCRKGGKIEDTICKGCLCNCLPATIGIGQRLKKGGIELPVVTLGKDLSFIHHLMSHPNDNYDVKDVLRYLLRAM